MPAAKKPRGPAARVNHPGLLTRYWKSFIQSELPWYVRYSVSLLMVLSGLIMAAYFHEYGLALCMTFASTIMATIFGGFGAGLLASFVSIVGADYFFLNPLGSVLEDQNAYLRLGLFIALYVVVSSIIASLRSTYRIAEDATDQARRATRAIETLMTVVTHDLKNPLTAVNLNLNVLARLIGQSGKKDLVEKSAGLFERTESSVVRMRRLLEDLLDFGRIEAGFFSVSPKAIDAQRLMIDALETFKPMAEKEGVRLESQFDLQKIRVWADPERIHQVFSNLLGNAIKFTPRGGSIRLESEIREREKKVCFRVCDTGRGISEDEIVHIFDQYWQARDTAHKGAGLGLFICKNIVQAHRGQIVAASSLGKGTTFDFTLPMIGN